MALSYVDPKLFHSYKHNNNYKAVVFTQLLVFKKESSNLKCMISFNYNKIVKGRYQIISMTGAVLNLNFSFSNSLLNTP